MKKNYSILFHFLLFILLAMSLSIPAFADYKTYIFNKNNRCVINNVTMSRKEISSNKYDLYMTKGNKKTIISSAYDGEDIISDGDTIYFCETRYNKKWLFELNIRKETVTRLKALSDEKQNIRILDNYKGKIYYVKNHLDLYSYNFKNENIKRELHNKHVILWKRKKHYFIISGSDLKTGAPQLGLYDVNNGKYNTISTNIKEWITKSNTIYYVEGLTYDDNLDVKGTINVSVKKYSISGKKKKTIVKKIVISRMGNLTSTSFSYYDKNKKLKTKKW